MRCSRLILKVITNHRTKFHITASQLCRGQGKEYHRWGGDNGTRGLLLSAYCCNSSIHLWYTPARPERLLSGKSYDVIIISDISENRMARRMEGDIGSILEGGV
jgi:hypothetical protein